MNYKKKYAFSLSTHQFRVRHVQGVQIKQLEKYTSTQLKILHPVHKQLIFTSSVYQQSSYPQWALQSVLETLQSSRNLILQIWDHTTNTLLIEQFITLAALTYLSEKNSTELQQIQYGANTVILVIHDSLFYSKHGVYPDIGTNVSLEEHEIKKPYVNVISAHTRVSYDSHAVYTLHSRYRSVKETRYAIRNIKRELAEKTTKTQQDILTDFKCRITCLRDKHNKFSDHLGKEIKKLESTRERYNETCINRDQLKTRLRLLQDNMSHQLEKIDWKIKYTVKSKARLLKRRQTLIGLLQDVFPIDSNAISRDIRICGVGISDQIGDKASEDELGPALGYTTHVVNLISSFLDIPLRFPLTAALSLSTVRDDVTDKLDEKRVLPLYIRGKDRFYLNYGIFLLNRNIAQLRHQCGLKTEELKETLLNLQSLMGAQLSGNMSAHPPAKLVSSDKILSKHKRKDPFRKTHKRVRSAPISYGVHMATHHSLSLLDDSRILERAHSNVPSEVSSWSSQLSVGLGSMDKLSSTVNDSVETSSVDEVTVTDAPTDPLPASTDLLTVPTDLLTVPTDLLLSIPDSLTSPSLAIETPDPTAKTPTPAPTANTPTPIDNQTSLFSPLPHNQTSLLPIPSLSLSPGDIEIQCDEEVQYNNGIHATAVEYVKYGPHQLYDSLNRVTTDHVTADHVTADHVTIDHVTQHEVHTSRGSSLVEQESDVNETARLRSSPTISRSSRFSSNSKPNRSSFTSYVRGSALWGRSEAGVARAPSFKSYKLLPNTTKSDLQARSPESNITSSTADSVVNNVSRAPAEEHVTCQHPALSAVRKYVAPQYYSTKRYMALDTPIVIRSSQVPSDHQPNCHSSGLMTFDTVRTQAPRSRTLDRSKPVFSVTPDFCPTEMFE